MTIQLFHARVRRFRKKIHSGNFLSFRYMNYENDRTPLILFMFMVTGTQSGTPYIQGINLHYLPVPLRTRFLGEYEKYYKRYVIKEQSARLNWKYLQTRMPYITYAVRRYNTKYVRSMSTINIEDMDKKLNEERNKIYRVKRKV